MPRKQILFKIISGLHANINIHLSQNHININSQIHNQIPYQNITMLEDRVTNHPERLNNLFFLYSILMKTLFKLEPIIKNYNFTTLNTTDDTNLSKNFNYLYDTLSHHKGNLVHKDEIIKKLTNYKNLDQIRLRFRNISQIIDCVSCQKCQLHGKLQIYGLATMFKILFEKNVDIDLHRNEIISFINLVIKVGKSINYLMDMKNLYRRPKARDIIIYYFIGISMVLVLFVLNIYYVRMERGDLVKDKFSSSSLFSKDGKIKGN